MEIIYTTAPPSETTLILEGTKYVQQKPVATIAAYFAYDYYKVEVPKENVENQLGEWRVNGYLTSGESYMKDNEELGRVRWHD